ncbi:hypothetical protein HAX54_035659, partial [Datura stramonium]|nr:hypothetical protein [Datura stramonium]
RLIWIGNQTCSLYKDRRKAVSLAENLHFTRSRVKKVIRDSSFPTWTIKKTRSNMDSGLINSIISSEVTHTFPITTDPSTSIGPEATSEVIARLEQKIAELNHVVMQNRDVSQSLPNTTPLPDVRQKGPMLPPPIPISVELDQGDYFNTSQQVQNASLCRLDADQYVENENESRVNNDEMVKLKLKSLED